MNGDGTHGGFIAKTGGTVTFEGCVFDGKIIGPNTTLSSGFLGYDPNHTSKGINCVFDAAEIDTLSTTSTFIRATDQDINSYYTWAIGQGRDYGKQARSVTAGKGVTLGFGTGTAYDVSGIVAHRTGLEYNDVFYAGKDETVSLVMADPSANGYYIADAGTFSGSGKNYQLVMPDGDVVISMVYTKLPAPKDVRIEKYTSENGYLNSDDALIGKWSATNGAAGYYVTPYQIKNGTAEALCDPVDVGNTLSYNLTGDFAWRNAQGNGIFTFGVQAYGNGDVKPSSVAKASEPVEFYDIILE